MTKPLSISVSCTTDSSTILQKAENLAHKLELPFHPEIVKTDSDLILAYTSAGLQLLKLTTRSKIKRLLFVDFIRGKNGYRHAKNLTIHQPLAKAVGIRSGIRPTVLDATAGLGGDSFVLACLGCEVSMCERSSILHALLEDGLFRAAFEDKTSEIVTQRMRLVREDTRSFISRSEDSFDTIYLDPMYPHRKKQALNREEMRVIRDLVGDDIDSGELLNVALTRAKKRVVVKRPKGASLLSNHQPTYEVLMKNSRFDIYLRASHP